MNKNLQQLIIPQPSAPQKIMHRGRSAQRLAALSRQTHCSHCGKPQENNTVLLHVKKYLDSTLPRFATLFAVYRYIDTVYLDKARGGHRAYKMRLVCFCIWLKNYSEIF